MQVTHMKDHVTHAVIAPGNVQEFGISQSAEFFQMLSSSLYSDKMLAVVRETLCNAWDAHIEAGITNIPVEVTVDNKRLVIRDFGPGIPDHMIGPIYGVYGGSTKVANENVTGGFGLGCKSPFAYNDHFETTSWSQGRMTIYNMSLSSAMVGGRPSITTMVSIPSDDTGLQVAIDLKDPLDRHRFEKLVRRIASFGEMNIKLNGEVVSTMPFSTAQHGFLIVKRDKMPDGNSAQLIHIRYGNVVYPLEVKEEYTSEYKQATNVLQQLNGSNRNYWGHGEDKWVVILQAKPNSISVTPSRESLSMTAHTMQTVKGLLQSFADYSYNKLENVCFEYTKEATSLSWLMSTPSELMLKIDKLPNREYHKSNFNKIGRSEFITDIQQAGRIYLKGSVDSYPSQKDFKNFKVRDFENRLKALVEGKFGQTGLINSFYQAHRRGEFEDNVHGRAGVWKKDKYFVKKKNPYFSWLQRRMLWPLTQGLTVDKELEAKRLHVVIKNPTYRMNMPYAFIETSKYTPTSPEEVLPLLRGLVVIAYNRMDVGDRTGEFPMLKNWFGDIAGSLLYVCQRKPEKVAAALKFFGDRGYTIVDLTKVQPWESKEVIEPKIREAAPVKRRKKGIPRLDQLFQRFTLEDLQKDPTLTREKANMAPFYAWDDEADRIENPEFVVVIGPTRENVGQLGKLNAGASRSIVTLWGDKGGIVANNVQYNKLIEAGAISIDAWLPAKMEHEWVHNPLIEQYFRNRSHGTDASMYKHSGSLSYHQTELLSIIKKDPQLRKLYGFSDPLPLREQHLIRIWRTLDQWDLRRPEWKPITELTVKWTPSPALLTFIDHSNNYLVKLFDTTQLAVLLNPDRKSLGRVKLADAAREMLLSALLS